jgi:hypothetical protein
MTKTALRLRRHGPDPQDEETAVTTTSTANNVNTAPIILPSRWGQ